MPSPHTAPHFTLARRLLAGATLALALAGVPPAQTPARPEAQPAAGERLQVADAFLELHTGPGAATRCSTSSSASAG
jgi:hypothetical protein